MPVVRVLVVANSVLAYEELRDLLREDPTVEVVGMASDEQRAMKKFLRARPDLVILDRRQDSELSRTLLFTLRRQQPSLPVVLLESETAPASSLGSASPDALANESLSLPESIPKQLVASLRAGLLAKIKLLTRPRALEVLRRPAVQMHRVELIVVGVSTGGPAALATLLTGLNETLPVPMVIVQHMPAQFISMLAARLAGMSGVLVKEAQHGEFLRPACAYLCPGNYHLEIRQKGRLPFCHLTQEPPENSCRPSADVLFRTAAEVYGAGVIGVVLTGMGQDGLRGSQKIHQAGGVILAQDEATSVIWGMPGAVVRAGLASVVLPLDQIAAEILARTRFLRSPSSISRRSGAN